MVEQLTRNDLLRHNVPQGSITLWWLGQAGFLIKSPAGTLLALDPYLSNSCKDLGLTLGYDMDRLVPAPITPEELVGVDAYLFSHSHQDHLDPQTLQPYRAAGGKGPFIAPPETVEKLRTMGVPDEELRMIWPNKSFTVGDITVRATLAIPLGGDDLTHVGYLVSIQDGPSAYFTGDTGYHEVMALSVAEHAPDIVATVINPTFRNLGPAEAAQLIKVIDPKVAIPCHYDLFPDNALPPQLLRTNLNLLGIADKYRLLEHGIPFTFTRG